MAEISVDGAKVAYVAQGDGPATILFVHGGFGAGSGLWRTTLAALPPGWRGIAIDNFVRSDPPPGGYTIAGFARRVLGLIEALGAGPAVICGHSMGGVVCQRAAMDGPGLVAGLVLVATGPSVRAHGVALKLLAQLEARGATRGNLAEISRNWFATMPDPAAFEAYLDTAVQAPLHAMLEAQRSLIATDHEPDLHRIACPTMILHGALDHGRTMEHAQALRRGIRDSELVVFEASGHAPMWEAPDAFQAALARFLAARARAAG